MYGVFDGHAGARASRFASANLHKNLCDKFPKGNQKKTLAIALMILLIPTVPIMSDISFCNNPCGVVLRPSPLEGGRISG